MKRPTISSVTAPRGPDPRRGKDLVPYPNLSAFLFNPVYEGDDATPRQPGRVMISARGSEVQVTLKEPTLCVEAVLLLPTLDGLWKLLDAYVGDPNSRWAVDEWAESKKPRKRR